MADMGFTEPVCQILEECSPKRQTIMFSATLDEEVADIREKYQSAPQIIEIGPKEVSVTEMNHHFWLMPNSMKSRVSAEAIRKSGRGFIFCRTRAGVERVADEMESEGLRVTSIHGGMPQKKRSQAVEDFTEGRSHAIVATDVAARGLDIKGVHCVVHYDPPENGKAFKHRSGRTARAGGSGNVISLVQNPQKKKWSTIQKEVGLNIKFSTPEFKDLIQHEDISHILATQEEAAEIQGSEKIEEADQTMAVIVIGRKNTTVKETAMMILEAEAEDQEETTEAEAKVRGGGKSNRKSRGGKPRFNRNNRPPKVLAEAGAVAAITKESRATITLVVDILQAAIQTGFDIH